MPRRPGKINLGLVLSLLLNAALAAGVAYLLFGPKAKTPGETDPTTPTGTTAGGVVSAIGRVQPAGGLISVYGPPGDRVVEFHPLDPKDPETAGKPLATLSGEAERQAQLDALDAQIAESEALRDSIEASKEARLADIDAEASQAEVATAQDGNALKAKLKAVEAQKKRAVATSERLTSAREAGVKVSPQEQEEVDALLAQAEAEREATVAQMKKLEALKEEGKKSVAAKRATVEAEAKRALAQVPLSSLKANRKAAAQKLESGRLLCPIKNAVVVRYLSKPGDTVTTQPVLQLADTSKIVVIAEVYESDVGTVRGWLTPGKAVKAEINLRVLGKDASALNGSVKHVSQVSTVVAKNVLTPLGPREDADRRVVEVEVELDAEAAKVAKDYIGLQVRVTLMSGQ